jgi:acyl-CoA synthetase (AMP-forming)/AMP-acid ligase II
VQASVFGSHKLGIPYQPIAELFAQYRTRDPDKLAIVDLDGNSSITFGELEQVTTDIAFEFKRRGVEKGDRVLLLSDECLEKLLMWFGLWRIGAVVCPLNIEINEKIMVELTRSVNPKYVLCHSDLDIDALVGEHSAPRARFGRWKKSAKEDEFFSKLASGRRSVDIPERNNPEDIACIFCTSGTTARPKIVVYDHCAYWLNGLSTLEFLGLTENDRTLEYRSFGWNSAQVLSLMPFLEKGLTLHIAKRF